MLGPAGVAQLVEHIIRNDGVPGSSPGVGSRGGIGEPLCTVHWPGQTYTARSE